MPRMRERVCPLVELRGLCSAFQQTEATRTVAAARAWSAGCIAGSGVMTEDAGKLVMEKLVEALTKIGVTMADVCKAQTVLAELLKDIHSEQQEQRAAMERLAALIEGRGARSLRPN